MTDRVPFAAVLVPVVTFFALLYALGPLGEYAGFRLANFDFGMVFQSSDLLSRGEELFMSCRGVHAWADNQDYLQLVFAPFHWLAHPHRALLLVHALAAFAPGLFCLLYLWKRDRWTALGVAVLAWASPFMINMNMDLLHIETLTTVVLLGLYAAARRGGAGLFWAALLLALAAKEDVALSTGLLMVLFFLEHRRFPLDRRHFAAGLAVSVVVFFVNLKLVLPHYKVETCLWLNPAADVAAMDSVPAALAYKEVLASWYKPGFLAGMFLRREVLLYVLSVIWPMLFFLRRPTWLWLGPAAGVFVNVVSSSDHLISGYYHYDFCTFAAVLIVVLEGFLSPGSRHGRATGLCLAAVALGVNLISPMRTSLAEPFTAGFYDLTPTPEVALLEELDALLDADTSISADQTTLCYLLEGRSEVYQFKNPFETHLFGLYDQCVSFAEPPSIDLVLLKREMERRLAVLEGIVPADYVRLDDGSGPFLCWLSPEFAAGPLAPGIARLLLR